MLLNADVYHFSGENFFCVTDFFWVINWADFALWGKNYFY
jgi:hypothetical protein